MRLTMVTVPDQLWADHALPEGAKMVWCYLCTATHADNTFTLKEICTATGVSLPSLHKYLGALEAVGWLTYERVSLRTVRCEIHILEDDRHLILPSDILFDQHLPRGACFTWGVIFRMRGRFNYQTLRQTTGYSLDRLRKHLKALTDHRWLFGGPQRKARQTTFTFRGANPHAVKRAQEIQELERGLQAAKDKPGYSQGQYTLARLCRVMYPTVRIVENAELTGLDNIDTGGRMHCDLFFPDFGLAVEFHGNQHAGPTELYPSVEEFQARRKRDLLKRGLCQEMEIELVTMWAFELSRDRITELLGHRLPSPRDLAEKWHLLQWLDRKAESLRKAARKQKGRV